MTRPIDEMDVSAECRTAVLKDMTAGLVRREAAITHSAGRQLQTLQLLAEVTSAQRDGALDGGRAAVEAWVAAVLALLDRKDVRTEALFGGLRHHDMQHVAPLWRDEAP